MPHKTSWLIKEVFSNNMHLFYKGSRDRGRRGMNNFKKLHKLTF